MKKQDIFILNVIFFLSIILHCNVINGQMYEAVQNNDIEKIKTLNEKDPSLINKLNKYGESPLYIAAQLNKPDIITLLLKLGARVNVRNKNGEIPLHAASFMGYIECVQILIDNGANVNAQSHSGLLSEFPTPLWQAAIGMNPAAMPLLLNNGADPNVFSNNGDLLLYYICLKNDAKLFKMLIEGGADIDKKNAQGYSSYDYAISSKNDTIVEIAKKIKSSK